MNDYNDDFIMSLPGRGGCITDGTLTPISTCLIKKHFAYKDKPRTKHAKTIQLLIKEPTKQKEKEPNLAELNVNQPLPDQDSWSDPNNNDPNKNRRAFIDMSLGSRENPGNHHWELILDNSPFNRLHIPINDLNNLLDLAEKWLRNQL